MRFRIILYLGVYTLHVTRALGDLFLRFPSSCLYHRVFSLVSVLCTIYHSSCGDLWGCNALPNVPIVLGRSIG